MYLVSPFCGSSVKRSSSILNNIGGCPTAPPCSTFLTSSFSLALPGLLLRSILQKVTGLYQSLKVGGIAFDSEVKVGTFRQTKKYIINYFDLFFNFFSSISSLILTLFLHFSLDMHQLNRRWYFFSNVLTSASRPCVLNFLSLPLGNILLIN